MIVILLYSIATQYTVVLFLFIVFRFLRGVTYSREHDRFQRLRNKVIDLLRLSTPATRRRGLVARRGPHCINITVRRSPRVSLRRVDYKRITTRLAYVAGKIHEYVHAIISDVLGISTQRNRHVYRRRQVCATTAVHTTRMSESDHRRRTRDAVRLLHNPIRPGNAL